MKFSVHCDGAYRKKKRLNIAMQLRRWSRQHPKWDDRPLPVVVKKAGAIVARRTAAFYEEKVATWWRPDDVAFADALPLGATGQVMENVLRAQHQNRERVPASA